MHVAVSVVFLYLLFNPYYDTNYILFLFTSTVLSYNAIRLINFGSNRFFIRKFYANNKRSIIILLGILVSLLMYSVRDFSIQTWLVLLPFSIITFFYNYNSKLLPFNHLRNNGIVKIVVVALVWTGLTVIVPQYSMYNFVNYWQAILVFVYIFMLTMSFDQRDILIDEHSLGTVPQRYHLYIPYIYIVFLLLLISISFYTLAYIQLYPSLIALAISVFLCYKSTANKHFYYTAFWIEGLPIMWFILLQMTI